MRSLLLVLLLLLAVPVSAGVTVNQSIKSPYLSWSGIQQGADGKGFTLPDLRVVAASADASNRPPIWFSVDKVGGSSGVEVVINFALVWIGGPYRWATNLPIDFWAFLRAYEVPAGEYVISVWCFVDGVQSRTAFNYYYDPTRLIGVTEAQATHWAMLAGVVLCAVGAGIYVHFWNGSMRAV